MKKISYILKINKWKDTFFLSWFDWLLDMVRIIWSLLITIYTQCAFFLPGRSTPFPQDRAELLRNPAFLFRRLEQKGLALAGSLTLIKTSAPPREEAKVNHTFLATVSGATDVEPLNLVVKSCLLRAPIFLRILFSLFPSPEYTFYRLVQSSLPAATDGKPFLAAPKAELLYDSRRHSHHFLVLQRITGNVYTDYEGASSEHAVRFLQAVATMHGHFWGTNSELARQVRKINSAPVALVSKIMFLTPLRKHKLIWDTIEDYLANSIPSTICHGDCRYGNTLWPSDQSDPRVYFLDWEMHMWKDALWDVVYFIWLSVPPSQKTVPFEGALSKLDCEYINAWRQRVEEFLPKKSNFPRGFSFEALLRLAQLRYAFFVAVVVAVGAADEWQDNNPLDHKVWMNNIALRQDRLWERELENGEIAAALDEFAPNHSPWKPKLRALYEEGCKMKKKELAKRQMKEHE